MFAQFKKQVFALPLALGLVGATFAALPATSAEAAEQPVAVSAAKKAPKNHRPEIKGARMTVNVGERVETFLDAKDADGDPLTFKFVGYPLPGISVKDNYLYFDLPETQRSGFHRVTVRVSDGKSSTTASYILNIVNPNE